MSSSINREWARLLVDHHMKVEEEQWWPGNLDCSDGNGKYFIL
jgi:hypothetical protein